MPNVHPESHSGDILVFKLDQEHDFTGALDSVQLSFIIILSVTDGNQTTIFTYPHFKIVPEDILLKTVLHFLHLHCHLDVFV